MKPLHFTATTGKVSVARVLSTQAQQTLWPFHSYLRQAIRAAKLRQTEYQLPWERVTQEVELRLSAVNSRWRIPRPGVEWLVRGWTGDDSPDPSLPLIVDHRRLVDVRTVTSIGDAYAVEIDGSISADEFVMWSGRPVRLERRAVAPPTVLADASGKAFNVTSVAEDDDRHWIVTLDGRADNGQFTAGGQRWPGEPIGDLVGLHRLSDSDGTSFDITSGTLKVESPPAKGLLHGDNGVAYRWSKGGSRDRKGDWIQLLLPDTISGDAFLDPRAAFCEDDVKVVWTQERHTSDSEIKVLRVDRERYQLLLERVPPRGTQLHLPVDTRNLRLQRRALRQLVCRSRKADQNLP